MSKNYIFIEPINIEWTPGKNIFSSINRGREIIDTDDIYNEFFLPFVSEKYIEYLVLAIERQLFRSFKIYPLSKKYAERKQRQGLDPRVLIATGRYIDSFVYINKNNKIIITVADEEIEGGMSMLDLSRILEFGNSKMPRRTHWHAAYRHIGNNISQIYKGFCEAF